MSMTLFLHHAKLGIGSCSLTADGKAGYMKLIGATEGEEINVFFDDHRDIRQIAIDLEFLADELEEAQHEHD